MKVIIAREADYQQQHYCVMEFKGRFESEELPAKSLVHLGRLQRVGEGEYRLEIGVMDLVGRAVPLEEGWLYTETREGGEGTRVVLVRGVVRSKLVFDRRPCPNMQRTSLEPRPELASTMFRRE